jgi:hypothetical protein
MSDFWNPLRKQTDPASLINVWISMQISMQDVRTTAALQGRRTLNLIFSSIAGSVNYYTS